MQEGENRCNVPSESYPHFPVARNSRPPLRHPPGSEHTSESPVFGTALWGRMTSVMYGASLWGTQFNSSVDVWKISTYIMHQSRQELRKYIPLSIHKHGQKLTAHVPCREFHHPDLVALLRSCTGPRVRFLNDSRRTSTV